MSSQNIEKSYHAEIIKKSRIVLLFLMGALIFLILRLFWIQVVQHKEYKELALRQHWRKKLIRAERGQIRDRHGRLMAISVPGFSCYTDPKMVKDKEKTAEKLSFILKIAKSKLVKQLSHPKRRFVWLTRLLSEEKAREIKQLRLPGIYLQKEPRRLYPYGTLAAHILGFVSLDHEGVEGVESSFNPELRGKDGFTWEIQDGRMARWEIYSPQAPSQWPQNGATIYLTIDTVLQHFLEAELEKAVEMHHAVGGAAILLEVRTGDVLAMASRPIYDPNRFREYSSKTWRNKAISDVHELGSVMKPLILAAALSEGVLSTDTMVDCGKGACRIIPGRILHDTHPYGNLTARDVIVKSSNIGIARIGLMLGPQKIYHYLTNVGLNQKTGIELPGEGVGILKPAARWNNFTLTSVPMGHEICATPLEMVAAYNTLAGDGIYRPPAIISKMEYPDGAVLYRYQPGELKRVYPREVAKSMRQILRGVVESGTAKRANIKEVCVAGKTGTAQKLAKTGGYSSSDYLAVFVGFAPADSPTLCCLVMVDTPKNFHTGGVVAAPVVAHILKNALSHIKRASNGKI
jgi:cell division protein FtsI/penicillin-binding protein 2